jgi:urease alpha subunit
LPALSIAWVSKAGAEGKVQEYGLKKRIEPVKDCRNVRKSDMKFNDKRPKMKVDPERYVSRLVPPTTRVQTGRCAVSCFSSLHHADNFFS